MDPVSNWSSSIQPTNNSQYGIFKPDSSLGVSQIFNKTGWINNNITPPFSEYHHTNVSDRILWIVMLLVMGMLLIKDPQKITDIISYLRYFLKRILIRHGKRDEAI